MSKEKKEKNPNSAELLYTCNRIERENKFGLSSPFLFIFSRVSVRCFSKKKNNDNFHCKYIIWVYTYYFFLGTLSHLLFLTRSEIGIDRFRFFSEMVPCKYTGNNKMKEFINGLCVYRYFCVCWMSRYKVMREEETRFSDVTLFIFISSWSIIKFVSWLIFQLLIHFIFH
jgi:hypothetical protein